MYRYGLATNLFQDYPDGYEFTGENIPLHLTHVDALEVELGHDEFIGKVRKHLHGQKKFSVMPVADALYGPDKDIPVTIVELSPELKAFHEYLMSFLESEGAHLINPHFLNHKYEPHISIYGSRRVKLGEPIVLRNISIGNKRTDIEDPPYRIIATIPFS